MLKQRIIINIRAMELRIIMMLILLAIMWRRWNHREAVNSKNLLENGIKIITIRQNCIIREKSGCLNILAESCKGGELSQDLFPHWCDFFLADSSSILALLRTFRKSEVFARILEIVSDNSIHFYVIGECQLLMSSKHSNIQFFASPYLHDIIRELQPKCDCSKSFSPNRKWRPSLYKSDWLPRQRAETNSI